VSDSVANWRGTQPVLVEVHLSYSTADIQRHVFFAEEHEFEGEQPDAQPEQLLVIHGEYYRLVDEAPDGYTELSPESGVFRLLDRGAAE